MTRDCAPPTGCSSAPELDFAAARELVPYLRDLGVSHLYLSPSLQARPGSTHGYDVVDPTRRQRRARRRGRACARWRGAGLRDRARHRPQPHGRRDENRCWADEALARAVLRRRPGDRLVPALLRHRRPRRRARRGPRGLRADARARCSSSCARASSTGCASTIPTGSPTRPATCERLRDARRRARVGREDPRPRRARCATGRWTGTVGYEFLNDVAALFVDPAGEARADRRCTPSSPARRARSREVALRGAGSSRRRRRSRREVERLRRAARRAGGIAEALAALPVYRTYVEPWRGRVERRRPRGVAAAGIDGRLRRRAAARASAATTSSSRASSRRRRR